MSKDLIKDCINEWREKEGLDIDIIEPEETDSLELILKDAILTKIQIIINAQKLMGGFADTRIINMAENLKRDIYEGAK